MSIKSREKQKERETKQKTKQAERNAELLARDGYVPTPEEVKSLGMVFTPPELVKQMIDKLPDQDYLQKDKTSMDAACGTGNFLIELLRRRMAVGLSHVEALIGIYGVDINKKLVNICKKRLDLNSTDENIWFILDHNIVCANALDESHKGWKHYGYMWTPNTAYQKKNTVIYNWKRDMIVGGAKESNLIVLGEEINLTRSVSKTDESLPVVDKELDEKINNFFTA